MDEPRRRRIAEVTPEGNRKILTILGAVSVRGMIATMTVEAATDAEIFLAHLDRVLCQLQPGQVVIMGNLSSHKVAGVRERIEGAGASLLYLPPYSPDLNPIEKVWPNSNSNSAPPKREPPMLSSKPSQNFCSPSARKTQPPGSDCRSNPLQQY